MTEAENSDDERYANESFENESDTEVPEMSEFESETTENSDDGDDDDDENLPSVKANTESLKMQSLSSNYVVIKNTDVVPFASSSDEEDEVIVGQTLAEINTPTMLFEEASATSVSAISLDGENNESPEDIVEEEDEEEEELKKIQLMEEKYLQQISAETRDIPIKQTENLNEEQLDTDETLEDYEEITESDSEHENEAVVTAKVQPTLDYDDENASQVEYYEEITESICKYEGNCKSVNRKDSHAEAMESLDQTKLAQIIQSSLTNLKIVASKDNENQPCSFALEKETKMQTAEVVKVIGAQEIALAVTNALNSAGFHNLNANQVPVESNESHALICGNTTNEGNKTNGLETNDNEIVHYKDDFEQEKEVEVGKISNSYHKNNNQEICYDAHFDYHITSKTPTSFNSDDYILHANFIKTFYRTSSTDKLKAKSHPRKNMSFSNERMREIERHNQILLRKILTQKPTYSLKSKPSQSSLQKLPAQTSTRLTTSALNRKKQQRQIDLENQLLKTKIEAIAVRRHIT